MVCNLCESPAGLKRTISGHSSYDGALAQAGACTQVEICEMVPVGGRLHQRATTVLSALGNWLTKSGFSIQQLG